MTESLWAPWRSDYVGKKAPEGCFFCEAAREPENPERLVIAEEQGAILLLNRYPYTNGHLMVAPTNHVGKLEEITWKEAEVIWRLMVRAKAALDDLYHPAGYNIGWNLGLAAGAGVVDHLHLHVVPRWRGDVNFMTAVGEVRVIPESLEKTRAALIEKFRG